MEPAPKLVALRALKLGDLLAGVPALRALAVAFPEHRRLLAAPSWLEPLVALTATGFRVVDTPDLVPLAAELDHADVAVNLHGRGPESTRLLRATRPRRLLAFDVEGGPPWRDDDHERDRWCRLLRHHGVAAEASDLRLATPGPPPPGLAGVTVVHPGASTGARRWPPARWASVAAAEAAAGHRVVVTGTAGERELARAVAARAGLPDEAVLAGRTSLAELLAVVAAAGRVVSGDTGVAHVASAFATPSVVLFGPTPPAAWGPPPGPHVALWAGETSDPHADGPSAGLLAIGVADVIAALATLPTIAGGSASRPA